MNKKIDINNTTLEEICKCIAIINKLQEEGIMTFDLEKNRATIQVDKLTEYLENQNIQLQQENQQLKEQMVNLYEEFRLNNVSSTTQYRKILKK